MKCPVVDLMKFMAKVLHAAGATEPLATGVMSIATVETH
jgi:hypothetical protein